MAALLVSDMNLTGTGAPEHLSVGFVSAGFFHVLGVLPVFGHDFDVKQEQPGQDAVVLVSDKFWISHFSSSQEVLETLCTWTVAPTPLWESCPKASPG